MPPPPDPCRIAVAQAQGVAWRYAHGQLGEAGALAELGEITSGLDGGAVLAEAAGVILGACRQPEEREAAERAAQLCVEAGADEGAVPYWMMVGRERVEAAGKPPFGMRLIRQRGEDE
jgi:hypothetical protein